MSIRIRGFFFAAALLAAAIPESQAEYAPDPNFFNCTDATGYYNAAATNDWRTRLQTSDPSAMQDVSGKWYAEFSSPENNSVYNNIFTYDPAGGLEFTSKTCYAVAGIQRCVDDYGYGRFTAHRDGTGWIFITRNITSQTRINACGGGYWRLENGILIDQAGKRWQRVP
jgi:hypothetical protein